MSSPEFGILLCAGLGVRLRPITNAMPKPLVPFLDRPAAAYGFEAMVRAGVSQVGVNGFHRADQLEPFLAKATARRDDGALPAQSTLVIEEELLGTGGGARGVWDALGQPAGPIIVINGDIVADFPLEGMLKAHKRTGAVATLLTLDAPGGDGNVGVDEGRHFITQLPGHEIPHQARDRASAHWVTFGGVYILEPEVLERLPAGETSCLIRDGVGPLLADGARIATYTHEGFWADLGTPSRYASATWEALSDPARLPHGPVRPRESGVYIADPKTRHPSATFHGPVYVAPGAVIEAGAVVGPRAVIGAGCVVRSGVEVRESVLMHGAIAAHPTARQIVSGELCLRLT